ncbi:hypothetical protein AMELA_G00284940 [Ameiurus melas]|uniref:Uncharacterized protein n=1 Tax=Ameiurus melas TaxID=219545 RepID=A0A7J5ZME3_AMEME|nr:hypothetical protein AMELA_G00284940 [Ameiurus melas]
MRHQGDEDRWVFLEMADGCGCLNNTSQVVRNKTVWSSLRSLCHELHVCSSMERPSHDRQEMKGGGDKRVGRRAGTTEKDFQTRRNDGTETRGEREERERREKRRKGDMKHQQLHAELLFLPPGRYSGRHAPPVPHRLVQI